MPLESPTPYALVYWHPWEFMSALSAILEPFSKNPMVITLLAVYEHENGEKTLS